MYAHHAPSSASPRTNARHAVPAPGRGFVEQLAQIARNLRVSTPGLTDEESHLLKDVADERYQMVALQKLMSVSSRSRKPEDREALAELIRQRCVVGAVAVENARLAGDLETQAQGEADTAWRAYEQSLCPETGRARCRVTVERTREKMLAHYHGVRAVLDNLGWQLTHLSSL
jgi:hypothetical protein